VIASGLAPALVESGQMCCGVLVPSDEPAAGTARPAPADGVTVTPRWILHLDLDQFIAAVEIRRRPELRGRPVVVGGDGDPTRRRQVVATASYEARAFGVHSGMPLTTAHRRCPDAVFLPADREAYDAASAEVWEVVREIPVVVEVWGWDEGFLGTDVDDPETLAQQVRDVVARRTGFTCCIGIGDNKVRAKLATGFAKARDGETPDAAAGVFRLTRENWAAVMGDRPSDALWGIGSRTASKLAELGIGTVRELATADVDELRRRFGPTTGPWLASLGRGMGDRTVTSAPWVPRGRSREETLQEDLVDRADLEAVLRRIAGQVVEDVADSGRAVTQVGIKVRFVPFVTTTRVHKLAMPTTDPSVVEDNAVALLDRLELGRPVRLLGVRVELSDPRG
jgi:DNA polymerase-4